jgi:hypothetical protein
LVDVSTVTEVKFVRGLSNGCKVHPESDHEREQREAYEKDRAARLAEAERLAREA